MTVEQVTPALCKLGESPVWDAVRKKLWWIDIEQARVLRFDPVESSVEEHDVASVGALTIEADGRLVLFERDGAVCTEQSQKSVLHVAGVAGTRFNDAVCDRAGRVYCGEMPTPGRRGRLWRLEAGSEPVVIADPFLPNGAGFSPDGATFYFTDSLRRCIYAAAFDEQTGSIRDAHVFARVPRDEGMPDGLAVDVDGGVWSARHDGGMIVRYSPTGVESHRERLATSRPTGIAFGGDALEHLYIATAHVEGDPASGSLLRMTTGVAGIGVSCSRLFG
ncbi:MAG TPA: SMP-30/gluconolactonase/LRE family protein [Kofleriaceae bacterium]